MNTLLDPPGRELLPTLRSKMADFEIKQPDPAVHRELPHGWLLPYLLQMDDLLWGRWAYWGEMMETGALPARPIPRIEWAAGGGERRVSRMLETSLNAIPNYGSWQGWSGWGYVRYFFHWLLYGLGHSGNKSLPEEPQGCEGASDRLYQVFNLPALQLWPNDYWGDLLAESSYGKGQGFYPTPLEVCQCMAMMTFGDTDGEGKDSRLLTVCDPCVGTGRFPMVASNYSLRIYAQDIDPTVIQATLINGYLYAPWLVKPLPFLDNYSPESVGEALLQAAESNPGAQVYLSGSEPDPEGWKYEPVRKRRRAGEQVVTQGVLFGMEEVKR